MNIYLSQQHEFEADIIGTAISKAVGCSDDDIIESFARGFINELLWLENLVAKCSSGTVYSQHNALASLKRLLPKCQLPDTVEDSKSLAAVELSIHKGLGSLSNEERNEAYGSLDELWFVVARRRSMYLQPCSDHPHSLDRITNIMSNRLLQDMFPQHAAATPKAIKRNAEDLATQLQAFQSLSEWEATVRAVTNSNVDSVNEYYDCRSDRSRSQQSLLLEMAEQLSMEYDPDCEVFAFLSSITMATHASIRSKLLRLLQVCSPIFRSPR